ncbi:hypothetical protein EAO17_29075 [Klebsiella pneumoniae]|uniref:Secreted protein n=1 Tax=Klebsiella pneumoniae TaxID=573 RepID=A0ABD7J3T8_KLEPN|nr:hypothetical protein EAO17_29075 [Klebsiella pneumoniae]
MHIMSLLWLLVTDCEQRGCLHLLHIMSLWWLRHPTADKLRGVNLLRIGSLMRLEVSDCEQRVVFTSCT